MNSTVTINGGTGGRGGKGGQRGGGGGLGGRPQIGKDDTHRFSQISGGIGGEGGEGGIEGGLGGEGEGPGFTEQLLVPGVEEVLSRLPFMPIDEFCKQYRLSDKILGLLDEYGFETAGAIFEVSNSALKDGGFKPGQIAELTRALKSFLVKSQRV
ncbi:hypothetical protein C8R45DRAFT_547103 [Mycena sanguinolenta]|nr:hypothetical protein C8R45DRAFT_547103 [Mycena sanguinolenta]